LEADVPATVNRKLALALVAVLGLGILIVLISGGETQHRVTVVVPEAVGVLPGYQVRAAGRPVGTIEEASVTKDYKAKVVLALDDSVWPLPTDSTMTLRLGGTIKLSDRYIELRRGTGRESVGEDGAFPAKRFVTPVEFDDLVRTFDRRTRVDLKASADAAGAASKDAGPDLRRAVGTAPPAFDEVRGMLNDLGGDEQSLNVLVRSSDQLLDAVDRAQPGLGALIDGAGRTFSAVAAQSSALETALGEAPSTFVKARATLARADRTLDAASTMSQKLAPGVHAARTLAGPLEGALRTLDKTGPDVRTTLTALRKATPDLNTVLTRARVLMPVVQAVGAEGTKQLNCIRPYAPEIASFASTWGAGAWGSRGDSKDKYFRTGLGVSPYAALTPGVSGADLHKLLPMLTKTLVRPPGQLIDQPWLIPECGVTADTLDPNKDPEAMKYDPLSKKIDLFGESTTKAGR
jgi:ABC-type transporter Mla subunit MlaD